LNGNYFLLTRVHVISLKRKYGISGEGDVGTEGIRESKVGSEECGREEGKEIKVRKG
jgi:hypothetical protein